MGNSGKKGTGGSAEPANNHHAPPGGLQENEGDIISNEAGGISSIAQDDKQTSQIPVGNKPAQIPPAKGMDA